MTVSSLAGRIVFSTVAVFASTGFAQTAPGVVEAPATVAPASTARSDDRSAETLRPTFRLGDSAVPLGYEVRLAIDPNEEAFDGEIAIDLRLHRAQTVLWLNATGLAISAATLELDGQSIALSAVDGGEDFVGLRGLQPLPAGKGRLQIRYRGKLDTLSTRGLFKQREGADWYVVSQFEPISARRAWPCFDEPGWKTPWQLTLDVPRDLVAVSNTPTLDEKPLDAGHKRVRFGRTAPLPSYLVALAVGPFDVVDGGIAGMKKIPLRYFTPRGRGAEARYAREVTPRLIALLENYFGVPYPFEKLDSVTIPQTVNFGAMENVGMITYASRLLLAKPYQETDVFKRNYASVGAHEMAHQWFGDLVTLAWWDDVWLNEAFATWLASKTLYAFDPALDDGYAQTESRKRAIVLDRLASTRRVHNPVANKTDMEGAFDSITYQKGSQVLQMFEAALGPERFREGVRSYLKAHAFGNATADDFVSALADASDAHAETAAAFRAFLDQPGVPLIDVALNCGAAPSLALSQRRLVPLGSQAAAGGEWSTPACFKYQSGAAAQTVCGSVTGNASLLALPAGARCPAWTLGNAGGAGYYVARYDAALLGAILKNIPRLPVHEAAALVSDSGILVESGLLSVDAVLDVAQAALRHASPVVKRTAVELLDSLREEWLSAAQHARFDAIMRQQVNPLALQLGWRERTGESYSVHELRITVLPVAADRGGALPLRAEAERLARQWIARREAVPAGVVEVMLDTAGRFGNREAAARLEAEAAATRETRERTQLLSALVKARDPAQREHALSLALDPRFGGRDVLTMLEKALKEDASRPAAFAYVRANFAALKAKVPPDTPANFINELGRNCAAGERTQFESFFKPRADEFIGGSLKYRQSLEKMDLCIAAHG